MLSHLLQKIFGSSNERFLKKTKKPVEHIKALESDYEKLSDEQLKAKTAAFKERLKNGETLDDIMVEAIATVREAGKRVYGMRLFDVQVIGGIVLHQGMIAEMKTGEGKTFVATVAVYLNALSGEGVHVVTVNDYLASRDAAWAGQLYAFLGLSVGCIVHGLSDQQRRDAYACDVTYGTNHEFGFDYLRDNMKYSREDMVQRPFNFAIVDEADSILIDEARTPLIISGAAEDSSDLYQRIDALMPRLKDEDFEKDEKQKSVMLTESGIELMESALREAGILKTQNLYDSENITVVHHLNSALRAHKMFTRDVDYIVKDGKIVIIDEFTGRMMEGRRYSEGLHQALEAKEHVKIEPENQTMASITYQNYFRLYKKLACMTGTAMTEAAEFEEIYKLHTVAIPTNVPVARIDHDDDVYLTAREKYNAVIELIKDRHAAYQPLLVGTISIEKSEVLSQLLKDAKIPHQVLNARQHEQESLIIANAGCPGAVTIATNMAGRGTDIKLGGNLEMRLEHGLRGIEDERERAEREREIRAQHLSDEEAVKKAGGLFVIGTERHESRRIDNQMRGRSGRQGDPGASKFYVSLEDDLMRIFGSERLDAMLRKLGVKEGEAISHGWISKALQRAQQKVEARNFDIRKHLLKYDDVMNDQRKVVYGKRLEFMGDAPVLDLIAEMRHDVVDDILQDHIPENAMVEQWDVEGITQAMIRIFNLSLPIKEWIDADGITESDLHERLISEVDAAYAQREESVGEAYLRSAEKSALLNTLDGVWKEHLLRLDHLRQGINLRSYAQANPLHEYKREAFNLFQSMLHHLREDVTSALYHFDTQQNSAPSMDDMFGGHIDMDALRELLPSLKGKENLSMDEILSALSSHEDALDDEDTDVLEDEETLEEIPNSETAAQDIAVEQLNPQPLEEKKPARASSRKRTAKSTVKAVAKEDPKDVPSPTKKRTPRKKTVQKEDDTSSSAAARSTARKSKSTPVDAKPRAKKAEPQKKVKTPETALQESMEEKPLDLAGGGRLPIQRNADCPCGSKKKYKHCHGAL